MSSPVSVDIFVEARAHEAFLLAMLQRIATEEKVQVSPSIRYRLYEGARGFEPVAYANLARLKRPAAELFRRLERP